MVLVDIFVPRSGSGEPRAGGAMLGGAVPGLGLGGGRRERWVSDALSVSVQRCETPKKLGEV